MTLPGSLQGWLASGINAPSSEFAGDGSVWYGVTMKRDGGIWYCVWREAPVGVYELKWNGAKGLHRGTMHAQLNGKLVVTAYAGEGDGSATERIDIPGYVPLPILAAHVVQLGQRITAIETALGNIGSGSAGLDPTDRAALDRLKAWLGI